MLSSDVSYDLDALADGVYLRQLLRETLFKDVIEFSKIGQGFYGTVYDVRLDGQEDPVVVKWFSFKGHAQHEARQLKALSQYALVKIPLVYAIHNETSDLPYEAIVMERIEGTNASMVEFPDLASQNRFVADVLDNLLAWHDTTNPAGFGPLDGPFVDSWKQHYLTRVEFLIRKMESPKLKHVPSQYVWNIIQASAHRFDDIFTNTAAKSSLVHSDCNLWNIMVDPKRLTITGVIDPSDAEWADPEVDLWHLDNCDGNRLGLLAEYLRRRPRPEMFELRYAFYKLWDDIKHFVRMGWYDEERFAGFARDLETQMKVFLS